MIFYHALFATSILLLLGEVHSSDPCLIMTCPAGQFCVSRVPQCSQPPCARVGFCVSSVSLAICPALVCPQPCPPDQVRKFDSAGCKMCDCYDPCEDVKCPPNMECVVQANDKCVQAVCVDIEIQWGYGWTEPHYDTFDGAGIDFQGVGTYVMSQYANNNPDICHGLRDFQVLAEQEIRNGDDSVSYIGSVTLVLPDIVTVTIGQNRQLTVISGAIPAGMKISKLMVVPVPDIPLPNGQVLRIETSFGLIVQYDGDTWASVGIPGVYRYCVEGMLGNADGNPDNDYRTRSGVDVGGQPSNMKFWTFGNSWRVVAPFTPPPPSGKLQARPRRSTGKDAARYKIAPLTGKEQRVDSRDMSCTGEMMETVDNLCGILINADGPFAECIESMGERAQAIFNGCKYDVCANWENMDLAESLALSNIGILLAICAENGLVTQMREV